MEPDYGEHDGQKEWIDWFEYFGVYHVLKSAWNEMGKKQMHGYLILKTQLDTR